jgi:hypothetical protein
MRCYECDQEAVAVCRWCGVGQCREHLAASRVDRGGVTMACHHEQWGDSRRSPSRVEVDRR